MKMKDRVVIVTGGAQGIGEAYCRGLAREGAKVVIADIDDTAGSKLEKELNSDGVTAKYVRADVSKKADAEKLIDTAVSVFGGLDALVNNASILEAQGVEDITEVVWDKHMAVNAKGTIFCSQAAARVMKEQKRGKIVNISSIGALSAQPGLCAYHSTKAAIFTITRSFAAELMEWNIQVNAVVPGTTNSGMAERAMRDPEFRKRVVETIPMDRLGRPEELFGAVLYFASDDSNYCTAQTLVVDGGVLGIM